MPSSVKELFDIAKLKIEGHVKWGESIPEDSPGVYIVSMSELADDKDKVLETAPRLRYCIEMD